MGIKEGILTLFEKQNDLSVKEITDRLGSSKQMVHLVLKEFLESGKVEKFGRTPKTFYRFRRQEKEKKASFPFSAQEMEFLKRNFLAITESGVLLEGAAGFDNWCAKRKLDPLTTVKEFIETKNLYEPYYDQQKNINGIDKLKNTKAYDKVHLDHLFYLDFYAIERFGKTRIGTLLHYAKQGQNKLLMKQLMAEIRQRMIAFIGQQNADAIAFIPPTIRREVQIMKFIQNDLNLALPVVEIKKLNGIIPVPQRSLPKIEERISNAENTFAVTEKRRFRHVVIIDDEVGSGATLNQVAGKIKDRKLAGEVTGLGITGILKGFDVTTEMRIRD